MTTADDIAALPVLPFTDEEADTFESVFPCPHCGYNGENYFQPGTHPCAARYHAAKDEGGYTRYLSAHLAMAERLLREMLAWIDSDADDYLDTSKARAYPAHREAE